MYLALVLRLKNTPVRNPVDNIVSFLQILANNYRFLEYPAHIEIIKTIRTKLNKHYTNDIFSLKLVIVRTRHGALNFLVLATTKKLLINKPSKPLELLFPTV